MCQRLEVVQLHTPDSCTFNEDRLDNLHIELIVLQVDQVCSWLTSLNISLNSQSQSVCQVCKVSILVQDILRCIVLSNIDSTIFCCDGSKQSVICINLSTGSIYCNLVGFTAYTNILLISLLCYRCKCECYRCFVSELSISCTKTILHDIQYTLVECVCNNQVLILASSMRVCCVTNLDVELIPTSCIGVSLVPSSSLLVIRRIQYRSLRSLVDGIWSPCQLYIDRSISGLLRSKLNPNRLCYILLCYKVSISCSIVNSPLQDISLVTKTIACSLNNFTEVVSNLELTVSILLVLVICVECPVSLELFLAYAELAANLILNLFPCDSLNAIESVAWVTLHGVSVVDRISSCLNRNNLLICNLNNDITNSSYLIVSVLIYQCYTYQWCTTDNLTTSLFLVTVNGQCCTSNLSMSTFVSVMTRSDIAYERVSQLEALLVDNSLTTPHHVSATAVAVYVDPLVKVDTLLIIILDFESWVVIYTRLTIMTDSLNGCLSQVIIVICLCLTSSLSLVDDEVLNNILLQSCPIRSDSCIILGSF